jgi:hypothetical protein
MRALYQDMDIGEQTELYALFCDVADGRGPSVLADRLARPRRPLAPAVHPRHGAPGHTPVARRPAHERRRTQEGAEERSRPRRHGLHKQQALGS